MNQPTPLPVAILNEAVTIATAGAATAGRPGQEKLLRDTWSSMAARGHLIGRAPAGVGKSLAYASAAAAAAVGCGERTVVSTESLALQAQLIGKDLPVVAEAVKNVTGGDLTFSVLKGKANYACGLRCVQTANALLARTGSAEGGSNDPLVLAAAVDAERQSLARSGEVTVDGVPVRAAKLRSALAWALPASIGTDGSTGDFNAASVEVPDDMRSLLSATTDSCAGKDCDYIDSCRSEAAKTTAAGSAIVVTNHAMLGVQVAKAIPVVIGSKTIGRFDHVIIDEAHALPGVVRSQGASDVSGPAVRRLVATCTRSTGLAQSVDKRLGDPGRRLAGAVAVELLDVVHRMAPRSIDTEAPIVLDPGVDPLALTGPDLARWISTTKQTLVTHNRDLRRAANQMRPGDPSRNTNRDHQFACRKALARLATVDGALAQARTAEVGVARWMEVSNRTGDAVASVELSPVNVGPALNGLVWTRHETKERGEDTDAADEDSEEHRLSVTAVSATVPTGFAREAGLDAVTGDYETPFAQAYARSRLLVPRLGDADAEAVTAPDRYRPGRRVFDAVRHRRWAAGCITELVEANGGRALVLAATTVSGRAYADALRDAARGRWQVRSQWEPATTGQIVDAWRADTASVLVGTRGLFTGVDAPGDTCSLVVIDRIPRARPNPVDDARRDAFASDLQLNRWEADVLVYVSDAAVTLEQGVGRLIRSTGDSGLVAVLDPRLAGGAVKQLSPGSVAAYRKVLGVFPDRHQRFSTVEHARRFLAANEPAGAA